MQQDEPSIPAQGRPAPGRSISRRAFLKGCTALASLLALPPALIPVLAKALERAARQPVIWLSFQECTGCTESLTRSEAPTIQELLFELISLDYHHTLQAASGTAAEAARQQAMRAFQGRYLLMVDGSIPLAAGGACSTIAGMSNLAMLRECAAGAQAIIAVGTCSSFGGLPAAAPNPTGAVSVGLLMEQGEISRKPLVNVPGCPPIPVVISAVLAHYLVFGAFPKLDELHRPIVFYGETVHDRCPRLNFFKEKKFAKTFDDEGARNGWCLYELGCRGPVTHNACATLRWNGGTSFPVHSGHPCLGCSEPGFWDGGGFYRAVALPGTRAAASQVEAADGEALFEGNCVYCHTPEPTAFRTPVAKIPELLRSGRVGAHRFELTDAQLKSLTDYLANLGTGLGTGPAK